MQLRSRGRRERGRIARVHTRRDAVVVFDHAHHGRTNLTMTMTAKNMPYKQRFGRSQARSTGADVLPVPRVLADHRCPRRGAMPLQAQSKAVLRSTVIPPRKGHPHRTHLPMSVRLRARMSTPVLTSPRAAVCAGWVDSAQPHRGGAGRSSHSLSPCVHELTACPGCEPLSRCWTRQDPYVAHTLGADQPSRGPARAHLRRYTQP